MAKEEALRGGMIFLAIIFALGFFALITTTLIIYLIYVSPTEIFFGDLSLRVVPSVDLTKYSTTWYEIARLSTFQNEDCQFTTAQYEYVLKSVNPFVIDYVNVVNACGQAPQPCPFQDNLIRGKLTLASGTKSTVGSGIVEPGKFKVQFGIFSGDYWIIELDPDYKWAIVGVPSRRNIWIISTIPVIDNTLFAELIIMSRLERFETNKMKVTNQVGLTEEQKKQMEIIIEKSCSF